MIFRERTVDRKVTSTIGRDVLHKLDEIAFENRDEALSLTTSGTRSGMDWIGCRETATLERRVREGWPELEAKMLRMVERVELPLAMTRPETTRTRKRRRGDSGNELDIHAVYQGRVDRAWDRVEHEEVKTQGNKLVHIDINLAAACMIDFDSALWRGAVALRLYEALIGMHKSVAISAYYVAKSALVNGRAAMVSVKIKDYGEPMDTDKLSAMINLGFMRHYLMMKGLNAHPLGTRAAGGRGYPIDDYDLWCHAAEEDAKRGGAVVHIGQCFTESKAREVLAKFIAQYVSDEKVAAASTEDLLTQDCDRRS